jgi:hypothetical protein
MASGIGGSRWIEDRPAIKRPLASEVRNPTYQFGHREIQIRPQGVKPGQYRGGLVHSESATHSRDLVPATGNKVAHAITEREAREAGDQNNRRKVRH